eukprot:SAG11_NODE_16490_length_546_cov_0.697987_1_plen_82_part_00
MLSHASLIVKDEENAALRDQLKDRQLEQQMVQLELFQLEQEQLEQLEQVEQEQLRIQSAAVNAPSKVVLDPFSAQVAGAGK